MPAAPATASRWRCRSRPRSGPRAPARSWRHPRPPAPALPRPPAATAGAPSEPDADDQLRRARPDLHAELLALRDEIRRDEPTAARILQKFSRKNTSGYSLNAFLDEGRPRSE